MRFSYVILALLLGLVIAGCYNREGLIFDRIEKKILAWEAAHPGKAPGQKELAKFRDEAAKEEDEERAREKAEALTGLAGGAVSLATGSYVAGGVSILGAIITFLAIKRRPKAKQGPPQAIVGAGVKVVEVPPKV